MNKATLYKAFETKYEELKGYIDWYSYQVSSGIYILDPIYFASEKDDALSLEQRLQSAAENSFGFPFEVICVQKDASEAEAYLSLCLAGRSLTVNSKIGPVVVAYEPAFIFVRIKCGNICPGRFTG